MKDAFSRCHPVLNFFYFCSVFAFTMFVQHPVFLMISFVGAVVYGIVLNMTHTYQGEKNAAGSIFLDMNASVDFSDDNSLVYGHNMKNGTMFGSLKNIRNTEIVKNNPYIWVFIDNTAFRYQIFSWHDAKVTDESFQTIFDTLEEKQEYLDYIEKIAEYKLDVSIEEEDKIITLSTCTSDSSVRFLVHGVLTDEVPE